MGPPQALIQRVPGVLFSRIEKTGLKLATRVNIVLRLQKSRAIPGTLLRLSRSAQGQLSFTAATAAATRNISNKIEEGRSLPRIIDDRSNGLNL
jgi:hypothetical protein